MELSLVAKTNADYEEDIWILNVLAIECRGKKMSSLVVSACNNSPRNAHKMKEKCDAYDVMLRQSLVPDGQPLAIKCSLEKSLKSEDYNLTWYKVGNQTAVPRDKLSRIHQQKNLIWFLPAMLEDSGDYECVIRNLTSCRKMCTKVTVFERIDSLCLNEKFAVEEVIFTLSSAKVVCPHLDYFRNEKNIQPVRWYKDCQLLEGKRFAFSDSDLIIFDVTVHDQGNYTCETTYTYNGKQYNISRDVSLTVEVSPPKKPPEISYPRNNSIEVELDGKTYDAYVLYTKSSRGRSFHRLETFVHRILPDVLEQQCGYNLFILGRDDSPGEAVVSVADETVKQSRRLMIILGSEASSCCLLEDTSEQQLAMYNALIRDGIQVILIEIDEIQDYTSMPESIKYIKQKHGAIQWKGDFSEKSCSANTRFWKYVRYQMPSRKKVSYSEVYLLPLTLNNSVAKGS
ncbi:interleukin-1 receptor type 1-like [Grus japonensis]|uniref:Interleukin-1 receptor type 1-like n=1 Tax=Grus japonensis TaxID=30415 RepID=A0ABC9W0B7_GRUJA